MTQEIKHNIDVHKGSVVHCIPYLRLLIIVILFYFSFCEKPKFLQEINKDT